MTVRLHHLFPKTSNSPSPSPFLFCVQRCAGFLILKILSLNSENPLSDHRFSFALLASLSEDNVLVAFIFSSQTDSYLMPYTVIWLKPCYNLKHLSPKSPNDLISRSVVFSHQVWSSFLFEILTSLAWKTHYPGLPAHPVGSFYFFLLIPPYPLPTNGDKASSWLLVVLGFFFPIYMYIFWCGPFFKSLYWICYNIAFALCFGFLGQEACGTLALSAMGSLNHWTIREITILIFGCPHPLSWDQNFWS